MRARQRLLFLQLPRLDPDVTTPGENVMLAAACLMHAVASSPEARYWEMVETPSTQDTGDNACVLDEIVSLRPDVIGVTLYLWNVERTLRLVSALKRRLPGLRIVAGGPEVAREHPLLDGAQTVDVAVIGEGEAVFPGILGACRRGRKTQWRTVGWHDGARRRWGFRMPPVKPLAALLPPPEDSIFRPDKQGMAYLETNRGCPMRCAFCCYNLRRRGWSSLPSADIEQRIRVLRSRGAREIRLVDPTFNAHPHFRDVLKAMGHANKDRRVRFFVELRADTLSESDARALARANVVEAEVGVQSTDPAVLDTIHRPTRLDRVLTGIARLQQHGIRPTIDCMYGLPGQGMDDITRCLNMLAGYSQAHAQFLPTLLLPGTELRDRCRELGLRGQRLPPYRVLSTDRLTSRQLADVEALAMKRLGAFDTPTRRFVGRRLPDLFADRKLVNVPQTESMATDVVGSSNCRAIIMRGENLFAHRMTLVSWMRRWVASEPDILWQFVLAPVCEEPLDLLETMLDTVRRMPPHWLDRLVSPPGQHVYAARRVLILLPRARPFDASWCAAAEGMLANAFH